MRALDEISSIAVLQARTTRSSRNLTQNSVVRPLPSATRFFVAFANYFPKSIPFFCGAQHRHLKLWEVNFQRNLAKNRAQNPKISPAAPKSVTFLRREKNRKWGTASGTAIFGAAPPPKFVYQVGYNENSISCFVRIFPAEFQKNVIVMQIYPK